MKKLLGLLLAFCMVFTLAACGSSGNNDTKEPDTNVEVNQNKDIDVDLKKLVDEYEVFVGEYIEFMKKYKNADAADLVNMMQEYTEYMSDLTDWMEKIDEIDEKELTADEALYLAESSARINKLLSEVE